MDWLKEELLNRGLGKNEASAKAEEVRDKAWKAYNKAVKTDKK